jgi:hypothetical protein
MAHPGSAKLKKTQQHTTGMPLLGPAHHLFGCSSCDMGKLTKQARGKIKTREARANRERIQMDYGFFRGPKHLQRQINRKYGDMSVSSVQHKPIIVSREGYVAYLLIPPRQRNRPSKPLTYSYNILVSEMVHKGTSVLTKEAQHRRQARIHFRIHRT